MVSYLLYKVLHVLNCYMINLLFNLLVIVHVWLVVYIQIVSKKL